MLCEAFHHCNVFLAVSWLGEVFTFVGRLWTETGVNYDLFTHRSLMFSRTFQIKGIDKRSLPTILWSCAISPISCRGIPIKRWINYWAGFAKYLVFAHPRSILGSLGNNDGDGNESGKKGMGLDWQNNNFARASRFFVHSFAVMARLRPEPS